MFRPAGLFKSNQCPDQRCNRNPCLFSHEPVQNLAVPVQASLVSSDSGGSTSLRKPIRSTIPSNAVAKALTAPAANNNTSGPSNPPVPTVQPLASTSTTRPTPSNSSAARAQTGRASANPQQPTLTKRPVEAPSHTASPSPPAKVPKIAPGPVRRAAPPSVTSLSPTGAPILNINAANTNVPLKERQRMATVIYETFKTLYSDIPPGPRTATLAGEHAIAQEAENGAHAIGVIKKRPRPDRLNHPSVGTNGAIDARKAEAEAAKNSTLKRSQLQIPEGPGGTRVSDEGRQATCERCQALFVVHAPQSEEERHSFERCAYHWGKPYVNRSGGIREMIHRCCGSPTGSAGCVVGAHVFKDPEDFGLLHARHPYSESSAFGNESPRSAILDVAALDCEMIYTTAGMSIARVSVIDGAGKCVYDKLIKLDPGVEVLDYNTRFSGIRSLEEAQLDLDGVRREMRKFIGPETILIGHALENDMRALRMVHLNVVDTAILFPHQSGPPYRRALKDLARQHLGILIQNNVGENLGHSSLEDAVATLDLVKFWVRERRRIPSPR
ncbi:EXOIII protein [Rhizoctonia solani]|uniref:EXOIII protein n=1 Tax=Rhizoctonia solani TaxID=456999 RepID=A0A8H7IKU3_9AGAM|nr:EXOIII protein [Rhizoctonia solani]